jgi:hypothetical protein
MLHLPPLRSILLPGVAPLPSASLLPSALLLPTACLFLGTLLDRVAFLSLSRLLYRSILPLLLLYRIGQLLLLLSAWLRLL